MNLKRAAKPVEEKPTLVRITVKLPVESANELARRANIERRSLSTFAGIELEKIAKQEVA